jgi:ankyrin repeat protein
MLPLVTGFKWKEVEAALKANPSLLAVRDKRGRSWLHICCATNIEKRKLKSSDGVRTAEVLLTAGLDINEAAFTEEDFRATPLWYSVGFSKNRPLTEYLLKRGCDPNYCLWAAAFNNDVAAIRLLIEHGARIDSVAEDATPFLFAIQWSHFPAAEELLKLGADVNFQDSRGRTALHCMLKKGSDRKHILTILKYGARLDLKDAKGVTTAEIMRKKRDPAYRAIVASNAV